MARCQCDRRENDNSGLFTLISWDKNTFAAVVRCGEEGKLNVPVDPCPKLRLWPQAFNGWPEQWDCGYKGPNEFRFPVSVHTGRVSQAEHEGPTSTASHISRILHVVFYLVLYFITQCVLFASNLPCGIWRRWRGWPWRLGQKRFQTRWRCHGAVYGDTSSVKLGWSSLLVGIIVHPTL